MAKGCYVGVSGVARKVKKGYVGIEGKARKIKKAYIGIGGVARPCWSGGELAYYGQITALSQGRGGTAATTIGNYALFGGGANYNDRVDAYDKSLVRTTPTALRYGVQLAAATSVGDYALFGGGTYYDYDLGGTVQTNAITAYNTSLTRSAPTSLSVDRYGLAATAIGNYALFGGGYNVGWGSANGMQSVVDAYNTSLVRTSAPSLSTKTRHLAATTVGDYALFGGGENSTAVTAYSTSLTRTVITSLSSADADHNAATTVGNYALFGGGDCINYVDAYNASLTKTTASPLSAARYNLGAATIGDYAIFAGGYDDSNNFNNADAYDSSLVKTTPEGLSSARRGVTGASIGDYAIFAGGFTTAYTSRVDAYTIA